MRTMTRLLTIVCVVLAYALPALAQAGQVTGTIVDQAGLGVPGVTVQLSGGSSRDLTTSGVDGAYRFTGIASGTYRVTATIVGFSPATSGDVVVSETGATVPPLTLRLASVAETVVVSATRGDTPLIDAPATMTVLTSAELQSSPAQNYGDLLRSVPGLNVIQLSARDVNITSRQATGTLSNTQLVLLDGRSVYLDFFGIVLWDLMPANMDTIKQIEVVRGPASAVWGANALTGVVNIITKSPRESKGGEATITGGFLGRDAGSSIGKGVGGLFGANASFADAPNATWSYRVSGGYFRSDAFPRPSGAIPLIPDPRDPTGRATVGGATYPADGPGTFGTAFTNRGASQPKFDARVDQELGRKGRITYEGGVAGTQGVIYTGVGPFDIQSGSTLSFGRVNYSRDALKVNFFVNVLHAEAPNLLFPDAATGQPLQMNLTTKTFDFEAGDSFPIGGQQVLSVGGNIRRNAFDITLAPRSQDRNELGAYVQDEIFFDRVRFNIGARVDKFGNLSDPFFSPRLSANFKLQRDHSLRVSFNRAFRSPSVINNYLEANIISLQDLRGLAPLLPPQARPLVATPFPLVVRAVGSELPIGSTPQAKLTEQSLSAYEVAYTGTIQGRTTVGVSFYVNDLNHSINFVPLPPNLDPYTPANPPPGWQLGPAVLAGMAAQGIFLPRTAFTYLNLGPLRQKGLELSLDQRVNNSLSAFVNYSWQGQPQILSDPNPYPTSELDVPPTNRFNAGFNVDTGHWLGNLSANYSDRAFWSDVLTGPFHGYTDAYTMVNGAIGARWMNGKVTTSVKVTNLFNKDIQQHIFGDILKRMVVFEVRLKP
jgi:outer membrane receptor protein involved in Fe transport